MKIIKTFTIILCLLIAAGAFGQTNDVNKPTSVSAKKESSQKENPKKVDSVALWNKRIDSVISNTSLKVFQQWLYESATVKQYQEGKFVDLYNAFVQQQYNVWIASKSQPKK